MAGRGKGNPRGVTLGVPASPKDSAGVEGGGGLRGDRRHPPPPTCYPFVIPKSSEKVSLILSCVKINKSDGAKPPTFRLDS